MPRIDPIDPVVSWPADEGTIGVVGVAPWATLDFCRHVYSLVTAKRDWNYPRVLVDLNTKIPSRGRHLQLGERDPSPFIAATIEELAIQGATVCVVPCNTAHILFDRWGRKAPIPVLNIIDAVVSRLTELEFRSAVILGSSSVIESRIYTDRLAPAGIAVKESPLPQEFVTECIESVKQTGQMTATQEQRIHQQFSSRSSDLKSAVVLACTELSPITEVIGKEAVVDSNVELARASLKAIGILDRGRSWTSGPSSHAVASSNHS